MAVFNIDMIANSLGRIVPLSVVLPIEVPKIPGLELPPKKLPFKTIYLLHGYSGSHKDWLYGTRIEFLARIFNVAVVMPAGENSFYLDDEDKRQFYEKFICQDIIEFTRSVFPLSDRREDTTIAGLSMGGYGALRNGLKYHNVFGSIFAFSSALITDKISTMKEGESNQIAPYSYYQRVFGDLSELVGSDNDPKALATRLIQENDNIPQIFMACGTEDFLLAENRDFHAHLNKIGLEHEYRESPGEHNWAFWDEYIEKAMEWLYGKPEMPPIRR